MNTFSRLKGVVAIAIMLFLFEAAKAQTTPANALRFNLGFDTGLPTGNLTIGSKIVIGGTARLQYGLTNNLAITLTSGADHFISKDDPATGQPFDSFGTIPIKAGLKYFFIPHIYWGEEAGVALEEVDTGNGNKKFLVSSAVGWANKLWDFGVRYDNFSGQNDPYGFVALRIAYSFNSK
jgi:hypothetical protein